VVAGPRPRWLVALLTITSDSRLEAGSKEADSILASSLPLIRINVILGKTDVARPDPFVAVGHCALGCARPHCRLS